MPTRALLLLVVVVVQTSGGEACSNSSRRNREGTEVQSEQPNKRVTLGPTRLRYFEGENVLTMQAEMASDGGGAYYNVYVPTAQRWVTKMPEWCRHRRDEIMAEIRRLTKDRRVKWIDEG